MLDTMSGSSLAHGVYPTYVHIMFPPLTHHSEEEDTSRNCQPGFVVDDGIANAKYPDYYLQSHSGIQGSESLLRSLRYERTSRDCYHSKQAEPLYSAGQ